MEEVPEVPDVKAQHHKLIRKIGEESVTFVPLSFDLCSASLTATEVTFHQTAQERQAVPPYQGVDAPTCRLRVRRRTESVRPAVVRDG